MKQHQNKLYFSEVIFHSNWRVITSRKHLWNCLLFSCFVRHRKNKRRSEARREREFL